jgi:hypothetical protein
MPLRLSLSLSLCPPACLFASPDITAFIPTYNHAVPILGAGPHPFIIAPPDYAIHTTTSTLPHTSTSIHHHHHPRSNHSSHPRPHPTNSPSTMSSPSPTAKPTKASAAIPIPRAAHGSHASHTHGATPGSAGSSFPGSFSSGGKRRESLMCMLHTPGEVEWSEVNKADETQLSRLRGRSTLL